MLKIINHQLKEVGYEIQDEAKLSTLFGIGNGYFGIRGSFEEFGDVFIQGTYVRGVFDKIVEIPMTFADNTYMKSYYFDGQKLKQFEKEDSCINIADLVAIRFYINGKPFLPWEGANLKWERYINYRDGSLYRKVRWKDDEGNITDFIFKRTCSFDNNHIFFQEAEVKKINHDKDIEVYVGIDTLVKTNGQHKSKVTYEKNNQDNLELSFYFGDTYNLNASLVSKNQVDGFEYQEANVIDGFYYSKYVLKGNSGKVNKIVSLFASCDFEEKQDILQVARELSETCGNYEEVRKKHLISYMETMAKIDINIKGNDEIKALLQYANYQTVIGFNRFDNRHSLSAKNLTSEKYNQFVWWDAEILQLPIFLATFPKEARYCLEYRYRCLNKAKEIAKQDGYKGAKFAFCSSVDGSENVWIYARHPFLQIHITGDVGYAIINYYRHTLDQQFLKDMGLEMLVEICKYFCSRTTYLDGKYQILNVTGTDEHHPYVNNNAYTNYEVKFLLENTLRFIEKFNYQVDSNEISTFKEVLSKLYMPEVKNGVISQFDGYFKLKPYLPIVGNGAAKGFQMKSSGLYHQSQIIKQPDVMNLFSYLNFELNEDYKKNWRLYEKRCEASSSLTYPVHAICAIDNKEYDSFIKYYKESLKIDIDDIHNCAYQGVHAACIAGGWYCIFRGLFGIKIFEDVLEVNPHLIKGFDDISLNFVYHGIKIKAEIKNKQFVLTSNQSESIKIRFQNRIINHSKKTIITIKK